MHSLANFFQKAVMHSLNYVAVTTLQRHIVTEELISYRDSRDESSTYLQLYNTTDPAARHSWIAGGGGEEKRGALCPLRAGCTTAQRSSSISASFFMSTYFLFLDK